MIIVGSGALQRQDGAAILSAAGQVASGVTRPADPEWNPLNILHRVRRTKSQESTSMCVCI